MNILVLYNSAPNYYNFFNYLGMKLQSDGATIVAAVDSEFSREQCGLDNTPFQVYEFSSYFSKHSTNDELIGDYKKYNLNAALLSDFERAQIFGLWGVKGDAYFNKLKSALLSFYEEIFDRHSIDVVLYENVSNTFAHFAYFVAEEYGAFYCGLVSSRLPGRFAITSHPTSFDLPEKMFKVLVSGEKDVEASVLDWCHSYVEKIGTVQPDYMKVNGLSNLNILTRYFRRDRLKTILLLVKHLGDDFHHSFQIGNPLHHYIKLFNRNFLRALKARILVGLYDDSSVDDNYLLYPLHFHPESSTSILAGTYLDEYEVIRNIAFSLPEGFILYVKDHISAYGFPSLSFYRELKKLPNVRLISPHEDTRRLITYCEAVITLSSTMGYEALLMNKKVFLFGEVFYQFHKNVVRVENPAKLHKTFAENIGCRLIEDNEYTLKFVAAYFYSTRKGSLNLLEKEAQAKKNVDNVYPEVLEEIRSRITK